MKKLIIYLLILAGFVTALVYYVVKPEVPTVSGTPHVEAGIECLHDMIQKYDPAFFTFKSWTRIWYARHLRKWGFELSRDLHNYYQKYMALESDVACYVKRSNDSTLHMALSAADFKAAYNGIAEQHYLFAIE
jgi:hypothetical protein